MDPVDPQSANDYDDRTTEAVKSVLIEIGQIEIGQILGQTGRPPSSTSRSRA